MTIDEKYFRTHSAVQRKKNNSNQSKERQKRTSICPAGVSRRVSIGSQIKQYADRVFIMFSENGKMDLMHFKRWLNQAHDIERIIGAWFWPQIWRVYQGDQFGYESIEPDYQAQVMLGSIRKGGRKLRLAGIYQIFLFVFDEFSFEKPIQIVVLRGLEIDFKDKKSKIYLRHKSESYPSPTLRFFDKKTYQLWKGYLGRFSNEHKINRY